ncbi:hypothetical protein PYCCODRAFT_571365 [Trametes coccinea BRFM310]|uniref:Uncharacterized protein n=1 Tax=Trametes coccinea (strain BRFM310) TaxID=1353009 RepID=A0A1Y2ILH2_TRAC3|nr:hypothetical protein PYCCODRAFT_571365 [Trametes coccinea BRFM310]
MHVVLRRYCIRLRFVTCHSSVAVPDPCRPCGIYSAASTRRRRLPPSRHIPLRYRQSICAVNMSTAGDDFCIGCCGVCCVACTETCNAWCNTKSYGSGGNAGCCTGCCGKSFDQDDFAPNGAAAGRRSIDAQPAPQIPMSDKPTTS